MHMTAQNNLKQVNGKYLNNFLTIFCSFFKIQIGICLNNYFDIPWIRQEHDGSWSNPYFHRRSMFKFETSFVQDLKGS